MLSRLVSQPLAALPSQLPKPDEHVMVQVPLVQPGVPLVALHARPQAPQWAMLLLVFTQPAITDPHPVPLDTR